jgi:hypothetical protein
VIKEGKICINKRFLVQLLDKAKEQCYLKQTTKSNPAHAANLKPRIMHGTPCSIMHRVFPRLFTTPNSFIPKKKINSQIFGSKKNNNII